MSLIKLVDVERFPNCARTPRLNRKDAAKFFGISASLLTKDCKSLELVGRQPLSLAQLYSVWCFRSYLLRHPEYDRKKLSRQLKNRKAAERIRTELLECGYDPDSFLFRLERWLDGQPVKTRLSRAVPSGVVGYRKRKATERTRRNTISRQTAAKLLSVSPKTITTATHIDLNIPRGQTRLSATDFKNLYLIRSVVELLRQMTNKRVFFKDVKRKIEQRHPDVFVACSLADSLGYTDAHANELFNAALQGQIKSVRFDLTGLQ